MKKQYAGAVLAVTSTANIAVSCGQLGWFTEGDCAGAITGSGGHIDVDKVVGWMGESTGDPVVMATSLAMPLPGGMALSGGRGLPKLSQVLRGVGLFGRPGAAITGARTCLRSFAGATLVLMRSEERRVGKECVSTCRYR